MRLLAVLAAFLLLTTFVAPEAGSSGARVTAAPVPLDMADAGRDRVGELVFLAGWSLTSNEPRFGGISALHVAGGRVVAIADTGMQLRFAVPGEGGPALDAAPLAGTGGTKAQRDSEALAVHGDRAWVAFEGSNVVRRYRLPGWTFEAGAAPAALRDWPANGGAEALVRLRDGRFLVFAEAAELAGGVTEAILFDGDPAEPGARATRLGYRPPEGYRATDAALLPDGRILILNRRFGLLHGVSAMLVAAELPEAAGAVIEGRAVATLRAPLTVDNMEAMSVAQEGGRTIVWIASDDNFSPLQRTLLMKFALD